jgi:hypothetical protein
MWVGGVGRVGHRAHDVKQELLALAIEISELRHLSPLVVPRRAPDRWPGLADTLAPSLDWTQGNRYAPSAPRLAAWPREARL